MELEEKFGVLVQFTRDSTKMDSAQAMVDTFGMTETIILDSGIKAREMARERNSDTMEP